MKDSVPPRLRAKSITACMLTLERVEEVHRRVATGLLRDFHDARGARDVHLGEVIADDVEPGEEDAGAHELRADGFGDLAIALRKRLRDAAPAGREVAARLARLR